MEENKSKIVRIFEDRYNKTVTVGNLKSDEINILMENVANDWIKLGKKLPDPNPLIGTIWRTGEVGILFSNTGKGKSVLGVQIADAISEGKEILNLQTTEQKIIYFDFELSTKAFQMRYTDENGISHHFNDKFIRVEIDRNKQLANETLSFEELIIHSIKHHVEKHNPESIIIDNISYLAVTNEKSQQALALMKLILDLSRKRNLSVLLIAHTPKRDIFKPIQLEDLAGSKALSNFTDVIFCIGESIQGSDIRYIKQLKNRNHKIDYHENNVIDCRLVKENSFLQFKFMGFGKESHHLKSVSNKDEEDDLLKRIIDLKENNLSNVKIALELGISEATVRRKLKMIDSSQISDDDEV